MKQGDTIATSGNDASAVGEYNPQFPNRDLQNLSTPGGDISTSAAQNTLCQDMQEEEGSKGNKLKLLFMFPPRGKSQQGHFSNI